MAIFFLFIGLELERELYNGERSHFKNALLPIVALANTGIVVSTEWLQNLTGTNTLGIAAGLLVGKPLGDRSIMKVQYGVFHAERFFS